MVWNDMVWFGKIAKLARPQLHEDRVWYDMVRNCMVFFSVEWYGMLKLPNYLADSCMRSVLTTFDSIRSVAKPLYGGLSPIVNYWILTEGARRLAQLLTACTAPSCWVDLKVVGIVGKSDKTRKNPRKLRKFSRKFRKILVRPKTKQKKVLT